MTQYDRPPSGEPPAAPVVFGAVFAVLVWRDGGTTDGSKTAACNRTYKCRTLDATAHDTGGIELGSSLTPKRRRPATGNLSVPGDSGAGEIGLAYYDTDETFVLYDANETLGTQACT